VEAETETVQEPVPVSVRPGICTVVADGCKSPPETRLPQARSRCVACGTTVCTGHKCSRRMNHAGMGKQRICAPCQRTKGENPERPPIPLATGNGICAKCEKNILGSPIEREGLKYHGRCRPDGARIRRALPRRPQPTRWRVDTNHPTYKKVEQLFIFMDDLGIQFRFSPSGRIALVDEGQPLSAAFELGDLDGGHRVTEMPPVLDWRVTVVAIDTKPAAED
jgi:hypothetical protein